MHTKNTINGAKWLHTSLTTIMNDLMCLYNGGYRTFLRKVCLLIEDEFFNEGFKLLLKTVCTCTFSNISCHFL